jgi:AraC-like DNA-binding protein
MTVVFRADAEPPGSRPEYWHHLVCETIGPLEVRAPTGPGARDRLLVGDAGAVRVAELLLTEPSVADRTPAHIGRSDPDVLKIDLVTQGAGVVEQDGRQALLRPGDFTLVDLSRPARWANPSVRIVAVLFPRSMLPLPRGELGRLTAVAIPGARGAGALVSAIGGRLPASLAEEGAGGPRLGSAMVDLLTVAFADRLDRDGDVPPATRGRALLHGALAHIEEHLGDPALTPAAVAASQFISLRYLHRLFEAEGVTVAAWIRRRRLERCRADLLDPAMRSWPVGAIGARWGLANAGAFSRAFRAEYGAPPGEYRLTSLAAAEPSAAGGRAGAPARPGGRRG